MRSQIVLPAERCLAVFVGALPSYWVRGMQSSHVLLEGFSSIFTLEFLFAFIALKKVGVDFVLLNRAARLSQSSGIGSSAPRIGWGIIQGLARTNISPAADQSDT